MLLSKDALRNPYFAVLNSHISYDITPWRNSTTAIRVSILEQKAMRIFWQIQVLDIIIASLRSTNIKVITL